MPTAEQIQIITLQISHATANVRSPLPVRGLVSFLFVKIQKNAAFLRHRQLSARRAAFKPVGEGFAEAAARNIVARFIRTGELRGEDREKLPTRRVVNVLRHDRLYSSIKQV